MARKKFTSPSGYSPDAFIADNLTVAVFGKMAESPERLQLMIRIFSIRNYLRRDLPETVGLLHIESAFEKHRLQILDDARTFYKAVLDGDTDFFRDVIRAIEICKQVEEGDCIPPFGAVDEVRARIYEYIKLRRAKEPVTAAEIEEHLDLTMENPPSRRTVERALKAIGLLGG